jgi:UDP-hydrolysing UDP-N-acetyl-D-glucosamine 2-epimerase
MRIAVVTGARADYGLIRPVLAAITDEPGWELQLLVTAAHLAPEFGLTVRQIEEDGFPIAARVESLVSSDTGEGAATSVGVGTIGSAQAFARLLPDLVMLVGDRFEQLAAAQAALFIGLPMAHLYGGDLTEGAFDDAIRHAITKLAHLHFVSNSPAQQRVIQLGEQPDRVFLVGSPAIDEMLTGPLLERDALESELGIELGKKTALVTFHPATLDDDRASDQLDEVLTAVAEVEDPLTVIITRANADPQGRAINRRIDEWLTRYPAWRVFDALGPRRFHSLLRHVQVIVGNSSSGLYEAPTFDIPAVNVGDRQAGRLRATSVIDVAVERDAIRSGIERALATSWSGTVNPYGDGHATQRIMAVLRGVSNPRTLLRKQFYDLPAVSQR